MVLSPPPLLAYELNAVESVLDVDDALPSLLTVLLIVAIAAIVALAAESVVLVVVAPTFQHGNSSDDVDLLDLPGHLDRFDLLDLSVAACAFAVVGTVAAAVDPAALEVSIETTKQILV